MLSRSLLGNPGALCREDALRYAHEVACRERRAANVWRNGKAYMVRASQYAPPPEGWDLVGFAHPDGRWIYAD